MAQLTVTAAEIDSGVAYAEDLKGRKTPAEIEAGVDLATTAKHKAQTLADAVTLAVTLNAGDLIETVEYNAGTGVGGNTYQLVDSSPDARPADDGGSVIHVGAGNLYLKGFFSQTINPFTFGLTPSNIAPAILNIQSAFPSGCYVLFPKRDDYTLKNVQLSTPMVLDFNNSSVTMTPSIDSLSSAAPCLDFRNAISSSYSINTSTKYLDEITLTTAGDDVNFTVGDYIIIRDDKVTTGWDEPTGSTSRSYSERTEINQIKSISSGVLKLSKPIEWLYDSTDSARVNIITNTCEGAEVKNVYITEPDEGGSYTGDVVMGPNLISFQFCINPKIANCHVDKYQLRAFSFVKCLNPYIENCSSKNPYRPLAEGHGYTVEFDRCVNGLAYRCTGTKVRRVIDSTQCYDTGSSFCTGYDVVSSGFSAHGQGAKRCFSKDDTVYGAFYGWLVGNASFNADYDFEIINPKYYGNDRFSAAIAFMTNSTGKVINPYVKITKNLSNGFEAISIMAGANNITINGGYIDMTDCVGQMFDSAVTTKDKTASADTFTTNPFDIKIENLKILSPPNAGWSIIALQLSGEFIVRNVDITSTDAGHDGVRVIQSIEHVEYTDITVRGTFDRGVVTSNAPTTQRIEDNRFTGTFNTGQDLAV